MFNDVFGIKGLLPKKVPKNSWVDVILDVKVVNNNKYWDSCSS